MSSVVRPHFLLICLFAALPLGLWFCAPAQAGDPFGFSSSWNYQENGGDAGESSRFHESYNLTYSKEMSAAMQFSGAVRYSENHPSAGADSTSLNPTLSLDLRNDLFSLNLNASESQTGQDGAPTRSSDSFGLNLNSQLEDWPNLRLYFNKSTATDDSAPKQTDNDATTLGASVEYSFEHIDLLYDVRHSKSSDNLLNSESEALDQTAQIGYEQSFLQGRVSVSASQQFQITENTTENRVGAGNAFFIDATALVGLYGLDDTPELATLLNKADLVDGDLNTSTGIDLFSTTTAQNIGLWANGQRVTRLRVVMEDDQLTTTLIGLQGLIKPWKVYRSDFGNVWTLVPNLAASYTTENGRTVVIIDLVAGVTAAYLKVVSDVNLTAATPINVTEIEAQEERVAATDLVVVSRESKNLQTQFSTTVRVTDNWSLSYNLRRVENLQDAGDSVQFSHSLSSSYTPTEKLGFSFSVSEDSDEADNVPGRQNRSYSASMSVRPLSTLNFSLGYTHSETETDDGQNSISDSLSSSLNASIYPDLSASLSATWTQSEEPGTGIETSGYGLTLNTTAYFTPRVDVNSNINYSESESNSGEDGRTTSYGFTLGYRPSDMLLLNFSYDAEVEDDSSVFSANSSWLWSKKLQSQFGFSFNFGDETSQQYNALLSWLISRSLSLQTSGNYQTADEGNSWNMNSALNMIF